MADRPDFCMACMNCNWTSRDPAAKHECPNNPATLRAQLRAAEGERDQQREFKNGAYAERNKCVVLLARMALALGYKAGVAQHEDKPGEAWDFDWRTIVFIDLPVGQVSWHFHDSEKDLLLGLPAYDGKWDGHDTPAKYARVLLTYPRTAAEEAKERAERERDEAQKDRNKAEEHRASVALRYHELEAKSERLQGLLDDTENARVLALADERRALARATAAEGALREAREDGEYLRKRVAALEKQLAGERDQLRRERHQHREHGKIIDRALESEEIECRRLLRSLNDIGLPPPETP